MLLIIHYVSELDEEVKQQILGGSHGQLLRKMSSISESSNSLARLVCLPFVPQVVTLPSWHVV